MTGKEIQKVIQKHYIINGCMAVCPNVNHFFINEVDVLVVKHGYSYDYEVKISRSDFFADKKKVSKHRMYSNPQSDWEKGRIPNYFIYAVPDGLVKENEVPEYAGLAYIQNDKLVTVKEPMKLHNLKPDMVKLRDKILTLYMERDALGCALLTHNNREAKKRFDEHEAKKLQNQKEFMEYAKALRERTAQ